MKILISICSCHAYSDRRGAVRDTWLKQLKGADYRFFVGRSEERNAALSPDVVELDCDDSYAGLSEKVRAIFRWSADRGYDFTHKCDDDTYERPDRLLSSGFERYQYSGFVEDRDIHLRAFNFPVYSHPRGGSGYWVDGEAQRILAAEMLDKRHQEELAGAEVLAKRGIFPVHDERYCDENRSIMRAGIIETNKFISLHKCNPEEMRRVHQQVSALITG